MSKPVSRGNPCVAPAEAGDDVAQMAVVHVDRPPPGHAVGVDVGVVAVEHVPVDERGQHVVRRGDGVEVAGEVQVQVLHRHDLGQAAAGGPALDAEDRAERRLAQAQHRPLADVAQPLRERHRRRRLALAGLGGGDGRDADDLRVGHARQPVERAQADLGLVLAVQVDLVLLEADLAGDIHDRAEGRFLCDLEAGLQRGLLGCMVVRVPNARRRLRRARTRSRSRRSGTAETARSGRACARSPRAPPSSCRRSARP